MSDDQSGQTPAAGPEADAARGQSATAPAAAPAPPAPAPQVPQTPAGPPVPPAPAGTAWRPPSAGDGRRGWRAGGAIFGVLLVVVGLIALFGGFTSVLDLLRLWPLLIVFGGLMRIANPRGEALVKRIAEGLGSIAVGLVLLGNTFGYIPWTVWITMLSLWPVLLVAIGIELVGRGLHMDWVRALSNIVLILALAYGVFVLRPASGQLYIPLTVTSQPGAAFSDSRPHDPGVTTGTAAIKVGATRLTLKAGSVLGSIVGRSPAADTPKLATSVSGGAASVSVSEPDRAVGLWLEDRALDVTLDRAVTWSEIRFDVGAVNADADMSRLDVARVIMNVGASQAQLKLGSMAKSVTVDISGGATAVTILVPASAACTLNAKSGLSNVRVPPGFRQTSGIAGIGTSTYVSDGSGGPAIAITLTSGVSDLAIETY